MRRPKRFPFLQSAIVVGFYALAMAYLEAAVVVYMQRALNIDPRALFPLRSNSSLGGLGAIEVGREVATLVMLVTLGWITGRGAAERLAWTSVAFGLWDLGYYGWLWVFIGWPTNLRTYDLLFLLPVPWVGPVWAPMTVSLALVSFGLLLAHRLHSGAIRRVRARHLFPLIAGGLVVITSFTLDAKKILIGAMPSPFVWPVFAVGMVLGLIGVVPLCFSRRRSAHE